MELLAKRKGDIARKWLDRIVASYPPDAGDFLKNKHDRFANPVGSALTRSTAAIVAALADGAPVGSMAADLEPMVRIRAVQDFSPSQAVSFVLMLKDVLREVLGEALDERQHRAQARELDRRVDQLSLLAFDIYTGCREQIAAIRVGELKRSVASLIKRSGWFEDSKQGGD